MSQSKKLHYASTIVFVSLVFTAGCTKTVYVTTTDAPVVTEAPIVTDAPTTTAPANTDAPTTTAPVVTVSSGNFVNGYLIEPGADLSGAELSGAYLEDVNLTNANLRGANLTNSNLRFAVLEGADLTGADLTGADLNRAHLAGATMPDGKKIPLTIGSTIDIPEYFTAMTDDELNALQDEIVAALAELDALEEIDDDEWGQQGRLEEALTNIVSEQDRRGR